MDKKTKTTTRTKKPTTTISNTVIEPLNKDNLMANIKIEIKHKNERQKQLTQSIKNNRLTACLGRSGTGKTYMACLQALHELKHNDNIKKIILVKSVTTLNDEEIGFLKGTMEEKMLPFMYSFIGAFEKIIGKGLFEMLRTEGLIEIQPIAYIRGLSIDNAIILVDESQNISIDNVRTIVTRLGSDSKMVLLGDVKQIDIKNKKISGLNYFINNFKDIKEIGFIEFFKEDIVRDPLVKLIEERFDELEDIALNTKPTSPPHRQKLANTTNPNSTNIGNQKTFFSKFMRLFKNIF